MVSSRNTLDDRVLVQRIRDGDAEALTALHDKYYAPLYRAVAIRVDSTETAQDVTQETFVRALEHLDSFQAAAPHSVYPWLLTIARNQITDAYRSSQRVRVTSLDDPVREELQSFLDVLPSEDPTPDQVLERAEVRDAVRRAMRTLPDLQYRAVVCRFVAQMSVAETAAALGKSVTAVKALVHRALCNLRDRLRSLAPETSTRATQTKATTADDQRTAIKLHR